MKEKAQKLNSGEISCKSQEAEFVYNTLAIMLNDAYALTDDGAEKYKKKPEDKIYARLKDGNYSRVKVGKETDGTYYLHIAVAEILNTRVKLLNFQCRLDKTDLNSGGVFTEDLEDEQESMWTLVYYGTKTSTYR